MSEIKMVVGLGNPGKKYAETRHNVGFRVIDSLCSVLEIELTKRKFGGYLGFGVFSGGSGEGKKLILLKPWRYMNLSGRVVAKAVRFYKLALEDLLVITDDMALEPGRIRIRAKGSSGGHKGLDDVIEELGAEDIPRLRIGIGQSEEDAEEFVLSRPTEDEKILLEKAVECARDAVICWIEYGIQKAMNQFNN
jgi:PTH1 family peptidyl-tRNA hydrolase